MEYDGSVKISTELDKGGLQKGLAGLGSFAKKGFSVIGTAATTAAKTAAVAITSIGTAMSGLSAMGIKYNAEIETYQTSFEVMTGSAEKAAAVIEELKEIGASTPFELPDLADTTQLLMNYGLSADEAMDKMMMLGDISQGSADKMSRIAMAYGQMSSAGKVSLEDIKQMIEAGFNPLQEISESTGESMASLYERISDGAISVDEITASMQRATSEGGKYYQSMEKQSQTISGMISTLKDNAQQLLGEITTPITEKFANEVLPAAIGMVEELTDVYERHGTEGLINAGKGIVADIITGITDKIPDFISTATTIVQSLYESMVEALPMLLESGSQLVSQLWQGIQAALPQLLSAGIEMIGQLGMGVQEAIPQLIAQALPIAANFSGSLREAAGQLVNAGIGFIEKILVGLIRSLPDLIAYVPTIVTNVVGIINDNVPKLIAAGAAMIGELIVGIVSCIPDLIANFPAIVEMIFSVITAVNWVGLGGKIISGIANGVKSLASAAVNAVKSVGQNGFKAFQGISWSDLGSGLIRKIVSGISSLITSIPSKLKSIGTTAMSAFKGLSWSSIGSNVISGIVSGITSAAGSLVDAAVNAASNAIERVKGWLGIHSPSRRAKEEIGEQIPAGAAEGVESGTPEFVQASEESAESAVAAMQKASAADFVARMQAKSYKAAENNEMAARSKWQNNGYDPDNPDEDGSIVIHNQFDVNGKPLVDETVKKTKREIAREQRANQAVKGDVALA